jgi:hypothetical protein
MHASRDGDVGWICNEVWLHVIRHDPVDLTCGTLLLMLLLAMPGLHGAESAGGLVDISVENLLELCQRHALEALLAAAVMPVGPLRLATPVAHTRAPGHSDAAAPCCKHCSN